MRRGAYTDAGERGAILMFVILTTVLIAAITLGVMQLIQADTMGGRRELQAVQTFNVAEAGAHWAIAHLQNPASGAANYAGGTQTITSGSTTLGTATITVNCIDTTTSNGYVPPCTSGSAYPAYRRVISVGTLPVGGPSRTVVAVVQGTSSGGGTYAVCSLGTLTAVGTVPGSVETIDASDLIHISGNIGANGAVSMTPCAGCGTVSVLSGTGYTGQVVSNSTISCGSGCSAAGGISQNQSGTVCSTPALPTFSPGATDLTVSPGTTTTINPTGTACTQASPCAYGNVTLNNGSASSNCQYKGGAVAYTALVINTSATDSTAVTYVQMKTLSMTYGSCTVLQITGVGKVDLRIGAASGVFPAAATSLDLSKTAIFGVGSTFPFTGVPTSSQLTPVAASRFTVWVNSNGTGWGIDCQDLTTACAVNFDHAQGGATIYAPNGPCQLDDDTTNDSGGHIVGAIVCQSMDITGTSYFDSDTSGLSGGGYGNFSTLMSWKDQ